MTNDIRRLMRLVEDVMLQPTIPRDDMAESITGWFAERGIHQRNNLASPLTVVVLEHTSDIRVDVRDWPEGQVDSMRRYIEERDAFQAFVADQGWHVTSEKAQESGGLGMVGSIRVRPNYPNEPVQVPRMLVHYTPSANLPAILEQGLKPRAMTSEDRYPPRIYLLLPGMKDGWQFTQTLMGSKPGPWSRLDIDTAGIDNATFYADPEFPSGGVWTYDPIPPSAIMHRTMAPAK